MTPKYASMNPTWKSSSDVNPSVRQCSCLKNSVEYPTTDQIFACLASPSRTSSLEPYQPFLNPGSEVIASMRVSV